MNCELDATGRRIVGVLIEKEATTPNQYPLTTNAVQTGSSQKNNRHPVQEYQSFEIDGALRGLMVNEWVVQVSGAGSRTPKWRHRADERLDISGAELAIMGELLLRGAQHPGELRTRASRMVPIADLAQLERLLENLAAKGLVRRLERQAGERAARVDHRLYSEGEGHATDEEATPAAAEAPPDLSPTPPPASLAAPASSATDDRSDRILELEIRVEDLEDKVRALQERLDHLGNG